MTPSLQFCSTINENNSLVVKGTQWYHPPLAGASTVAAGLFTFDVYNGVYNILNRLHSDDYLVFIQDFLRKGQATYGTNWRYADICTVLYMLSKMLKPNNYLEIGVRQGRSMAMVVANSPHVNITACDMWIKGYAGMDNLGPDFVEAQLRQIEHKGEKTFLSGDSHALLPEYFAQNPELSFDLITVDGDHSREGATADILTVITRLRIGGAIVFDDIAHPAHPELMSVWTRTVKSRPNMSCFEFTELGYGVAFAIRMF